MRSMLPWLLVATLAGCQGRDELARFGGTSERWARRGELNAARVDLSLRTLLDSLPARLAALPERSVTMVGPAEWESSVKPESARDRLAAIWNRAACSRAWLLAQNPFSQSLCCPSIRKPCLAPNTLRRFGDQSESPRCNCRWRDRNPSCCGSIHRVHRKSSNKLGLTGADLIESPRRNRQ